MENNPGPFGTLDQAIAGARSRDEVAAAAQLPVAPVWPAAFPDAEAWATSTLRALPGSVDFVFPGARDGRPILEARLHLDPVALLGNRTRERVLFSSEVVQDGVVRDRARWSLFVEADPNATTLPITFLQHVDLATTEIWLRLEVPATEQHYLSVLPIAVPSPSAELPVGHGTAPGYHALGDGGFDLVLAGHHVEILEPESGPKIERMTVQAAARGPRLAAVEWRLDGNTVATSSRAPFAATLPLPRLPIRRWLDAVAIDQHGTELARDRVLLNGGPHRLAVRLLSPQPRRIYRRPATIHAEVALPMTARLESVDLWVGEQRVGHLTSPPFEVEADLGDRAAVVRAVATLEDGRAAEAVVLANSPDFAGEVSVDLVELFTSVRDVDGHAVQDLTLTDFAVQEEGVPQTIERFERVERLPIHVLLAVDASGSMATRMPQARAATRAFLQEVVNPKDQAALVSFNHLPNVLSGFTHDGDTLARHVRGLDARGGTALHDTLVYALFQFGGLRGKRALVLISDGADEHSRFSVQEAVEFARRVGVAIYCIGVGFSPEFSVRPLDQVNPRLRPYVRLLRNLAADTGGLALFVKRSKDLATALQQIEDDLRSQYLLTYRSPAGDRKNFRRVVVDVLRPGLEARTIRGYFPD